MLTVLHGSVLVFKTSKNFMSSLRTGQNNYRGKTDQATSCLDDIKPVPQFKLAKLRPPVKAWSWLPAELVNQPISGWSGKKNELILSLVSVPGHFCSSSEWVGRRNCNR